MAVWALVEAAEAEAFNGESKKVSAEILTRQGSDGNVEPLRMEDVFLKANSRRKLVYEH
jgi:hypothetical protein